MASLIAALLLAGCSSAGPSPVGPSASGTRDPSFGVNTSPRDVAEGQAIPKGGGVYKIGTPYQVGGRWYEPRVQPNYDQTGIASWYGTDFHGRRTSNGEVFDMTALSAAHKTLPLPSYAYVTNLDNGRTILVRVNDRGPYVDDRLIDLSYASATALGTTHGGLGRVRVRYAGVAPLDGKDVRERQYLASQPWAGRTRFADNAPMQQAAPMRTGSGDAWSALIYRNGLGAR